ncbi:MAG: ATP-binding cassette domain-containing protein [Thermoflexales bacterium]|nr:ATP-binding cassette domain-containing protein [Thermoflexales bacterium]
MSIHIKGASEHNLQNVDVEFGQGLTVVTGVSGSGKTSLVFDTLYHEARRRFLEVFSLGSTHLRLSPARVEAITGLGPAVAVEQNVLNRNPNSTLASASGLHPFLRLLYARFGERRCARCGQTVAVLSGDQVVERLLVLAEQHPVAVFVPLLHDVRGSHRTLLETLLGAFGPGALLIDGQLAAGHGLKAGDALALEPGSSHTIEVQVARLASASPRAARQALQAAEALGAQALVVRGKNDCAWTLSLAPLCLSCGMWFGKLEPVHFHTACSHCDGKGCPRCDGTGLHPEAAAVRWRGLRLPELLARPVEDARALLAEEEGDFPARLRVEIERRLEALDAVGLGYIALDRPAPSLSRGEAQRVRLAVALTSWLEDMLHVLDEPTIGQHPADVARLLPVFRRLAGPVVYVEHDRVAAAGADWAVDLGPGAGREGGRLLFAGTPAGLWKADTPTGRYFSLRERVPSPQCRPEPDKWLLVQGATLRNLQDIDVPIPLGRLTVITGVSGSGKSTLVEDVLVASLSAGKPSGCRAVVGAWLKPVMVDQGPIGHNPRSNPATYTKLSDVIRDYFASVTGMSASHFSFNRPEGACPACNGMGAVEVKMRYLPSTWIPCEACDSQRFSDEVLSAQVSLAGRHFSIADFYGLSVSEVLLLLLEAEGLPPKDRRMAKHILEALHDVGLGYLPLGQPSPTLSGGEAQRVKLAKYLGQPGLSERLLVLDEPSTGLHPHDIAGLLTVLDRLVRSGATIVVVEHNSDIIRSADWVLDLGPGAGPRGGRLLYAGSPAGLEQAKESVTGRALREEAEVKPLSRRQGRGVRRSSSIAVRGARVHNLKGVDVDFPKGQLTVVTGVSGSGKSSLVGDVLEAEARRRFLETLSLYERQTTREGPEAAVDGVTGLGVTLTLGPERRRSYDYRAAVGAATEIAHHLAVLLAWVGERACLECGAAMQRQVSVASGTKIDPKGLGKPLGSGSYFRDNGDQAWHCSACGASAPAAEPRHFSPTTYAAVCLTCHGVGSLQLPMPDKLIVDPDKPLCGGAMYSPGFFPKGYLCKPFNGGYDMVQAVAARYGFDPATTPWNQMSPKAQQIFLFGDPDPMEVTFHSRSGRATTKTATFPGFYGWIRDWDVGGTYTQTQACPDCRGARLRPEYLAVTLGGYNVHQLSEMPLSELLHVLEAVPLDQAHVAAPLGNGVEIVLRRLRFLLRVGLGYLHLNRPSATLSAGEAQRIKLAGLLGSGLTSLTVLLDEPSRGLHPSEVEALLGALRQLCDEGNTVILVEHEPLVIGAADYLVDMGPGAGAAGGEIVAQGTPAQLAQAATVTARWLRGERRPDVRRSRREPRAWLVIRGARANNLRGEDVRLPQGVLVGVCGVSGSGKSTLLIDTLGRALAPKKYTTSVAQEPIEPGEHEAIEGAPGRTLVIDQARAGVTSPAAFLGLDRPLRALYAASDDAQAMGLDEKGLSRTCSACNGYGSIQIDMAFLPPLHVPCETCRGTGYLPEAWEVRLQGLALPELDMLTIDQVYEHLHDEEALARPLQAAREVGLGYLALHQPGHALSGGEAQRLKIARELCLKTSPGTLYILDEPTVGQHMEDVARLVGVLHRLVDGDRSADPNTVVVVEHHPHLLAACDWLIELGPGGGPDGGWIIANGSPELVAAGHTPTAPYLREVLER